MLYQVSQVFNQYMNYHGLNITSQKKIKWFNSRWMNRWIPTDLGKEYQLVFHSRGGISHIHLMHKVYGWPLEEHVYNTKSPKGFQDNLDFKHLAVFTPGNYWVAPLCHTEYITVCQTVCTNFLFGKYGQNRILLSLSSMGFMRVTFQNVSDRTWTWMS